MRIYSGKFDQWEIAMSKKQVVVFISFVFVLASGVVSVRGQEKKAELKDQRVTVQMAQKPLFDVFMRLIYDYDVAIGFEESVLDSEHNDYHFETNIPYDEPITLMPDGRRRITTGARPNIKNHLITVDFRNARLEDVMDDIVKQMKNYDWEITNDVVNVFPIRGRDTRFVKLLDLRIREFIVSKDASVGLIQPQIILFLPEFKVFLAANDLHADAVKTAPWYDDRPLPVGMKFSDLTFKELLNAITKSKRGGWILRKGKPNKIKDKELIDILI